MNIIKIQAVSNRVEIKSKSNKVTILPHTNTMVLKDTRKYLEEGYLTHFHTYTELREGK